MTRNLLCRFQLLLSFLISSPILHAQQLATLNVTVTDPTGKVLPSAHVTLSDTGTGRVRNQTADRSGFAVLTALSAGDYHLAVSAEGFGTYESPLTLTVGQ